MVICSLFSLNCAVYFNLHRVHCYEIKRYICFLETQVATTTTISDEQQSSQEAGSSFTFPSRLWKHIYWGKAYQSEKSLLLGTKAQDYNKTLRVIEQKVNTSQSTSIVTQ